MNKKPRSKNPLEAKAPFKLDFMDIIPATSPKRLTSGINFSNYLLIFGAYLRIQNIYGIENNYYRRSDVSVVYVPI